MIEKIAQPKWQREALSHLLAGRYGKGRKLIEKVRLGSGQGSALGVSHVMSGLKSVKGNKLSHQMTLGDERRSIAKVSTKKSVRVK